MKILILLLSITFILTSGCGGSSDENSQTGEISQMDENNQMDDSENKPKEKMEQKKDTRAKPAITNTAPTAKQKPAADSKTAQSGPCAKYSSSCQGDEECGEKYTKCLRPKAGDPETTKVTVCKRSQKTKEEKITLTLNEWTAPAGKNSLLCDFLELENNVKYLIRFATVVKNTCKNNIEERKKELIKVGFSCAPLEDPQQ